MSRRGWVLFGAMCVIWGIPYLLIKVAVRHLDPADLVFARTAIGAAVLLPIALRRRQLRPLLGRWRPFLAYSMAEVAIPWLLLSEAETQISSSLSGLLVAAVPLAGVLIALLSGSGERLGRTRLVGIGVGLAGVAAVVGLDLGHVTPLALLEMAGVIIGYAAGPQILARSLSDLPRLGVVGGSLGLCALLYLPAAVAARPAQVPSLEVIAALVGLGLVCTALAFVLFFELIAEAGPLRATVITYINPAVAVLLGVVLLHEPLTAGIGVGFALVLLGSVMATRGRRRRPRAALPGEGAAGVLGGPQ